MRRFVIMAIALLAIAPVRRAHADDKSVVAVLPLNVSGKGLAIYGKPVADAIAKRLKKDLGIAVETLPTSGAVPERVGLVVDGRIVSAGKRRVLLEARVRDPSLGKAGTAVVTKSGALSNIDQLAAQLASKLAPHVRRGLAQHKARVRRARQLAAKPKAVSKPAPLPDKQSGSPTTPSVDTDRRPIFVVTQPTGRAADVPVAPPLYWAAQRIAAATGHRTVRSVLTGVQRGGPAAKEIRSAGARFALMIHLSSVSFDWHGPILSARAKVRVVVVAPDGRRVYDRTARTGTLVGNRGDRHGALVNLIAEQASDIAAPQITRAIAR